MLFIFTSHYLFFIYLFFALFAKFYGFGFLSETISLFYVFFNLK